MKILSSSITKSTLLLSILFCSFNVISQDCGWSRICNCTYVGESQAEETLQVWLASNPHVNACRTQDIGGNAWINVCYHCGQDASVDPCNGGQIGASGLTWDQETQRCIADPTAQCLNNECFEQNLGTEQCSSDQPSTDNPLELPLATNTCQKMIFLFHNLLLFQRLVISIASAAAGHSVTPIR